MVHRQWQELIIVILATLKATETSQLAPLQEYTIKTTTTCVLGTFWF